MKGVFIPDVTVDEIKSTCLEGVEALIAEGTMLDMNTDTMRPKSHWIRHDDPDKGTYYECECCGVQWAIDGSPEQNEMYYCPKCGADMREEATP